MASNFMSRLLPSASDEGDHQADHLHHPSIGSDTDEHTDDMALDEENLAAPFADQDLDILLAEAQDDRLSEDSIQQAPLTAASKRQMNAAPLTRIRPKWMGNPSGPPKKVAQENLGHEEDDQEDVPVSLMFEPERGGSPELGRKRGRSVGDAQYELPAPVPGPSTRNTRAQWETTRRQQQLHDARQPAATPVRRPGRSGPRGGLMADPKEYALWRWAQVENLDKFLGDVYTYYDQKGFWSILLSRSINLLTALFVVWFVSYVSFCIDFTKLQHAHQINDIRIEHCSRGLPWGANITIWVLSGLWIWYLFHCIQDTPKKWEMHEFFHHVLGIPDKDMQSVTWQYVVRCLMDLRDKNVLTAPRETLSAENRKWLRNQSKQRMDAHDIANRLMRQENYWIAIVNKEILDCSVYIPFLGRRQFYTKTMEWNLGVALTEWVFEKDGQIKQEFLHSKNRKQLTSTLKKRFRQVAIYNSFCCIVLVIAFTVSRFLNYFTEYQKNPTSLGAREWTSMASWKLREFNEVNHLFNRRKTMAKHFADGYLEQFPRDKTAQLAKFLTFVSGAMLGVLGLITLFDNELFLGFEIQGKTVLFWLGALGGVWNIARGQIPAEDAVHDPEWWIEHVIECTHYKPKHWDGKLYSDEVLKDFSNLYKLEIILFLEEVASLIFVPVVFWWRLPNCAEQLVDFFREFTIHVDGLGHVCSFAVFDFQSGKQTNQKDLRADYYGARDNKLAESRQTFMLDYADPSRRGGGRERNKRTFFHPPAFPGLAASRLQQTLNLTQSAYHTSPLGPAQAAHIPGSPMHSILLDPQHQPRPSHQSPRQGPLGHLRSRAAPATSRYQNLHTEHHRNADLDEHDEDRPSMPMRTPSNIIEEDTDLGESWAVNADADVEGAAGRDRRGSRAVEENVGVVNMLHQLRRTQADRGINI